MTGLMRSRFDMSQDQTESKPQDVEEPPKEDLNGCPLHSSDPFMRMAGRAMVFIGERIKNPADLLCVNQYSLADALRSAFEQNAESSRPE